MAEQLIAERGQRKSVVTKTRNSIARYVAEENESKVKECVEKLMTAFEKFENVHMSYHDTLKESADIEGSDEYFSTVQKDYVASLNLAKDYLRALTEKMSTRSSQAEMMDVMNLPKIELEPYDGNPLTYHIFLATFDEVVHNSSCNSKVKLTRLLQYTTGRAKEAIKSCILLKGDEGYKQARSILAERFGNDHMVVERLVSNLRYGKQVKTTDDLLRFADDLSSAYTTLKGMNMLSEVDSQFCIREVAKRMESYAIRRWRRITLDHKNERGGYPNFDAFVKFVKQVAVEESDPMWGKVGVKSSSTSEGKTVSVSSRTSASFSVDATQQPLKSKLPPCVVCQADHRVLYCSKFREMLPVNRVKLVRDYKLCEICLLGNHQTLDCRKQYVCTMPGCGKRHSKFIHVHDNVDNVMPESGSDASIAVTNANVNTGVNVHLPIVPVKVNDELDTYALLDTGSSNSFCTRSLVEILELPTRNDKCKLNTLSGSSDISTKLVDIKLLSSDGREYVYLTNVFVVDSIPARTASINISVYPHLTDLSVAVSGRPVDVLIGQDHSEALIPLEVRTGNKHEPFAVRTLLGWSLNGPSKSKVILSNHKAMCNFITAESLDQRVDALWHIENEDWSCDKYVWSQNDRSVIELWEREVQMVQGHYQLPIPWKPNVQLNNNMFMALSRLKSTRLNLLKRGLMPQYRCEMQKLLTNGYAERVPANEICKTGRIWYLPHHAVVSDKRPGKVRIVFDCAAKYEGKSLNTACFSGPDLNNKLLSVLLRFRQHRIAIASDIEAMYYQVLIPAAERDALRFVWYDDQGEVAHFRMSRHVFGGVWCAASSTFALRRVLRDAMNPDPVIVDTIMRSFYVDDCLRSVPTKEEALLVIHGTRELLKLGGFNLTKFIVNDPEVLSTIDEDNRAKAVKDMDPDIFCKVLGVKWHVDDDCFYFEKNLESQSTITRRSMLSILSSIFDPLGHVGPFTLKARLLFREATQLKLAWDEALPLNLKMEWEKWLGEFSELSRVRIPRCVLPTHVPISDVMCELHHFSDASSKAYGCVSYLRSIDRSGSIKVSMISAKSKVAPIRYLSIPRLELQGAVMSAKMDDLIRREMDVSFAPSHFWTDSEVVIKYIFNCDSRFHVFVANRLSIIHGLTSAEQWNHIGGKLNPADIVSRGASPADIATLHEGPEFLRRYKSTWHVNSCDSTLSDDDPEVKSGKLAVTCVSFVDLEDHPVEKLSKYYSDWSRLKRAVAWLLRLKSILRNKTCGDRFLSVHDLRDAELVILKYVQSRFYAEEMRHLFEGDCVHKSSSIVSLDPKLDDDGLLVIGGRLRKGKLSDHNMHPYIVPYDHSIASLIVREEHEVSHLGIEWVTSLVRKKFWIPKIRRVAKGIASKCVTCRKLFAVTGDQKMGDHPSERLESHNPPFHFVGLDCFGPFMVKQGRSVVKRYGLILTCLNTRAVHLEKLDSMSADSFISGFRRFINRRGCPSKVWSDQGTNFIGGKAEMDRYIDMIDQDKIRVEALRLKIDWHFNPPGASHQGGIWERLIRTVRKVLTGILGTDQVGLSDEGLATLFCEVEGIINSRPITKVSDDVNDPGSLTPNHLLLLHAHTPVSPGEFDHPHLYGRMWCRVQYAAQLFWSKWLREYLPEIQKRHKWVLSKRNLKIGDIVLIKEENTPRGVWPMGLVTDVIMGSDGLVRSAHIKTKATTLVRPVTKLVFLEGS